MSSRQEVLEAVLTGLRPTGSHRDTQARAALTEALEQLRKSGNAS